MAAKSVVIDGVTFIEEAPSGPRHVIVVDRGWIFAGDLSIRSDGKIVLSRAVHVLSWFGGIGFSGLCSQGSKSPNVKLHRLEQDVIIPVDSEIFRVPVEQDWGL